MEGSLQSGLGRERSPSTGRHDTKNAPSHLTQIQNPSQFQLQFADPALSLNPESAFQHNIFQSAPGIAKSEPHGNDQYLFTTPYLASTSQSNSSFSPNSGVSTDQSFNHATNYPSTFDTGFLGQLEQPDTKRTTESLPFPSLGSSNPGLGFDEFTAFHPDPNTDFLSASNLDRTINQADFTKLSSPPIPSSPHLAAPESVSSPGRPASPSSPAAFYTPRHSRHTSLDPASAAYMTTGHSQSDWQGMLGNGSFQGHRRAPSEHSDVSSVSHSPYIQQLENFDTSAHASPLLPPQNDPTLYDNSLGMEGFSICEPSPHQRYTPSHSPYISPRLSPQQHNLEEPDKSLLLTQHLPSQVPGHSQDAYTGQPQTSSPHISGLAAQDMGQAAQMTPPSINVEFAPPSRTSTLEIPNIVADGDTLSPPIGRRGRSKSDPSGHHGMTRPITDSLNSSLANPTLPSNPRSLSPFSRSSGNLSTPSSRETSPAGKNRRQSTSSLENRSYILGLADPQRPGSAAVDSKRIQKHPATFQCNLCPKKFTRAYNLRSHLRTHTDERPFVCTVCGKAFARQHDRKRHESLHSGEKKFVCRGELSSAGQWGCGRRFARADALGRHFRSEAGRICIKPLLDEEAHERNSAFDPHHQHSQQGDSPHHLQPIGQSINVPSMDGRSGGFTLPAALLAQYPALQALQWDHTVPTDDTSDMGRSSFDASSGGEYGLGDDEDSNLHGGYLNGPGPSLSPDPSNPQHHGQHFEHHPGAGGWTQPNQNWTGDF
ncbi:DNA-binding transcription factor [Myotisia sp. PD_48]|nr:DNA-binding transcription factor [Myotisia sp. PD_48]